MTLEEYLKNNTHTFGEHRLKAIVHEDGTVSFYIHPYSANGDTEDFKVEGNSLIADPKITKN